MIPPLDIFRVGPDQQLIWRGAAADLESAHSRIKTLMADEPADYMIFSQQTGHKTLILANSPEQVKSANRPA